MSGHCQPVLEISIHAPARGATRCFALEVICRTISIHAPARGATFFCSFSFLLSFSFQSTLPRGERQDLSGQISFSDLISIHAPARGATSSGMLFELSEDISIHAPARGATISCRIFCFHYFISIHAPARGATHSNKVHHFVLKFQSTLPRGERRITFTFLYLIDYFNPRSREGSDQRNGIKKWIMLRFQSTLPRGERLHVCCTSESIS